MTKFLIAAILMLSARWLAAESLSPTPATNAVAMHSKSDSTSFLHAIKTGKANVHLRYFFMATDNHKGLSDYYANALGGTLRYETNKFYGLQFAVAGSVVYNIGSSNLTQPDSASQQLNRYEAGLFDVANPAAKVDLLRLEELYLKYNFRKSFIKAGYQYINTPFINQQDGRMTPTAVSGLWFEIKEVKKLKIEGGWLYGIAPRGTTKWYYGGNSLGIYPMGVNTNGKRNDYFGNIKSAGVGNLGISYQATPWLEVKLWDVFLENVQNTLLLQTDFNVAIKNQHAFIGSIQFIRQDAVNFGGNTDQTKSYLHKGDKAMTYGVKLGWKNKNIELTANYNRITKAGRYLMPREWGRDPFFTFLPRERNDGLGDVHAVAGKLNYNFPGIGLKTALAGGYYQLPDVKNFTLNKYGLPSYAQINAEIRYSFKGALKGMDAQLLIVGKINAGNTYDNPRFELNKVDMVLYNFVLNYNF